MRPEILAFAGSTRKHSLNKRLIACSAQAAEAAGANVTLIDLRDYPLPLYDGDLENDEGMPANAMELFKLMKPSHGLLISCPEYNSAISGVMKNVIDWLSRPIPDEPSLAAFTNKTAGLLAASPGRMGGVRGLASVRSILGNLGVFVVPKQFGLANASEAFDEEGNLVSETARRRVRAVVEQLVNATARLNSNGN